MQTFDLTSLGWTPELSEAFASLAAQGLIPGRVGARHRGHIALYTALGEIAATPSGRLRHAAEATAFPVVGDWVAARLMGEQALIEAVLPRRTAFTRAASDLTRRAPAAEPDVLAANIDLALVVCAANGELNPRRLERYLATAWQSGAVPVVVLTKIDLAPSPMAQVALVEEAAPGVTVHLVSNVTGAGVDEVGALLAPSRTAALIGPSGVGKSSLVNRLIGYDRQTIGDTDSTGRGRHTTTLRELLFVPGGGLVVDTPGLRALTPWDAAGLDGADAVGRRWPRRRLRRPRGDRRPVPLPRLSASMRARLRGLCRCRRRTDRGGPARRLSKTAPRARAPGAQGRLTRRNGASATPGRREAGQTTPRWTGRLVSTMDWIIEPRPVEHKDLASTRNLVDDAFRSADVATYLDSLRADGCILGEWLAEDSSGLLGHIVFSRVWVELPNGERAKAAMLSPLAVRPDRQRVGIGTQLMDFALKALEARDEALFFVLGHPEYYPRAGFCSVAASRVASQWSGRPSFMARGVVPEGRLVLPSVIADAP